MTTKRVLVIEDNEAWAGFLKVHLRRLGYNGKCVDVASTKESGIALARKKEYEIAIVDLVLPDGHEHEAGIEVIKWLHDHSHKTAVLVVSCIDDPEIVRQALDAGANMFMVKSMFTSKCFAQKVEEAKRYHGLMLDIEEAKSSQRKIAASMERILVGK